MTWATWSRMSAIDDLHEWVAVERKEGDVMF